MTAELDDVISHLGNVQTLMSINCLLNDDDDNTFTTLSDPDAAQSIVDKIHDVGHYKADDVNFSSTKALISV